MNSDEILAIIALAAIASPVLVAVFNNKHQERMQQEKLKFEFQTKQAEIEQRQRDNDINNLTRFSDSFHQLATNLDPHQMDIAMSLVPPLLAALDDARRKQLMVYSDALIAKGGYDIWQELHSFDSNLTDWVNYLETKPRRQLPTPPTLDRKD
ncbi:hypothetical protein [Lacticaseibacillus paracasei]|uniref:Uncharacterized protein n=1 Tax=Lacticaseibacillus paracasei TaxID=1597 RepID=A0A422M245_LACPA|nr:hypothetical protein [Lacticaseibacillus paracasei]EPC43067.1 hypothetical protein Lpp229_09698 [Lacticaseibacillus paracasei subsp. paracasei Lpp229]KTE98042.1 hypothetical protein AC564_2197c [Lacticaseibacillus paracasei]MCP9305286.1 hypothetical protein [Lacticaseibacillus paracasei]MCT3319095.1 hypothetical protein [Lacticaseibacillus paracasei]RND80927.1 hypothetical protein FAM18172_03032 [Lacticaseibacillus paracasei]